MTFPHATQHSQEDHVGMKLITWANAYLGVEKQEAALFRVVDVPAVSHVSQQITPQRGVGWIVVDEKTNQ